MHFLPAFSAFLLASGSSSFVSASIAPKRDVSPDHTPTKTTAQHDTVHETTPSLLGALFDMANTLDLRACIPGALPLITTLPQIPAALINPGMMKQALSQTTRELHHVCDFSVTGSSGDTFTAFLPAWYAWYHQHSDRVASIITKCPKASALVRTIEAYETCPQVIAQISSASAVAGNGNGVPTPSETVSTDAPHATGFLGAAAAVAAGVLGVVAVF